jgi:hypothetical protein
MSFNFRILATGDSTTFGSNPKSWFYQSLATPVAGDAFYYGVPGPRLATKWWPAPNVICHNWAYSGYKIADLNTQAASRDDMVNLTPPTGAGRPTIYNILACRIGTNRDEPTAAALASAVRTHYLAAQAAGWLVIDLPRWSKTGAGEDTFTQDYNAIKATWGTADGVAAVVPATEALLYGTGAYANTTYFNADGIHLTEAGQRLAARDFLATLDTVLVARGGLAMPTGLTATGGTGEVDIEWSYSTDPVEFHLYRNTIDDFASAAEIMVVDNDEGQPRTYTDTVAAGTYYYWLTAKLPAGQESIPTLSVSATPA